MSVHVVLLSFLEREKNGSWTLVPWHITKKAARKSAEMLIRAYTEYVMQSYMTSFHKKGMLGRGAQELKLLYLLQIFHFGEDSFVKKNDPRYNHKMGPVIWKEQWRKGSQVCPIQHLATLEKTSPVQWHHKIGSFMTCMTCSHLKCYGQSTWTGSKCSWPCLAVVCFDKEACSCCGGRLDCLSFISTLLQGTPSTLFNSKVKIWKPTEIGDRQLHRDTSICWCFMLVEGG